jgi:alkaline phosphatase D
MKMAFGDEQVRNMIAVGRTDHRSARVWCRAERSGPLLLRIQGTGFDRTVTLTISPDGARDNTAAATYPDDFPGEPSLQPTTRYRCDLRSATGDLVVGEASFDTTPARPEDTPSTFSVGLVSCHQPFSQAGIIPPDRLALLQQLPAWFSQNNVKLVLMVGDQVYGDEPGPYSLFNPAYAQSLGPSGDIRGWPEEDIRAAYHSRYRIFWQPMAWRKLMSSYSSYAILDDHEVFDDWGSLEPAEEDRRSRVAHAARLAYMDYQGSRQEAWDGSTPRSACDYQFRYGTVAGFTFDLRSERSRAKARVVSDAQLGRFQAFLDSNRDAEALMIVTSVPFVHIPEWVARKGAQYLPDVDFDDHWSAPHNLADRGKVVAALRRHLDRPETNGQKVVIVGGDVHIGAAFALRLVGSGRPIFQLTSSAVTNPVSDALARSLGALGPSLFDTFSRTSDNTVEIKLLEAAANRPQDNPFTGMNAGIVQFQRLGGRTNVRLKLLGADGAVVKEVFESALL